MMKVGDRIRLSSGKAPDREGVVTAVMGSMVRVRWPSAGETTLIPAPGTLTVLASSEAQTPPAVRSERAVRTKAKKASPTKAAATEGAKKVAVSKKAATKKTTGAKKVAVSKMAASKKSTGAKTAAASKTAASKKSTGQRSSR
jgi:hypothetical protein